MSYRDSRLEVVRRARTGDLAGMNFAGLVRLSFETERERERQASVEVLTMGRDINGRDTQVANCREYVTARGGVYTSTFDEPDTSAWKKSVVLLDNGEVAYRVKRPVYDLALASLRRGQAPDGTPLHGLIVSDLDRLTRDPRHLEDAIEVVQHFGVPIIDLSGTLDLLTDNGCTMARIIVSTKWQSSADTARRVADKHLVMQQAGITAGGPRPFGWKANKRELEEREAQAIRDGAKLLLAKARPGAVAALWNSEGLSTPRGNRWVRESVVQVYRNARLAGLRTRTVNNIEPSTGRNTRTQEIVLDANDEPIIGNWTPILDRGDWEAILARIGGPRQRGRGTNARKHVWSGTLTCGKCGSLLRAATKYRKAGTGPSYLAYCCRSKNQGGCGGICVPADPVNNHLLKAVFAKYELEAARRAGDGGPQEWNGESDLVGVQESIAELTAAWRSKQITGARYFALLAELEGEEAVLLEGKKRWLSSAGHLRFAKFDLRAEWKSMELPAQIAAIQDVLVSVQVNPVGSGRRKFNPDTRLTLFWR